MGAVNIIAHQVNGCEPLGGLVKHDIDRENRQQINMVGGNIRDQCHDSRPVPARIEEQKAASINSSNFSETSNEEVKLLRNN